MWPCTWIGWTSNPCFYGGLKFRGWFVSSHRVVESSRVVHVKVFRPPRQISQGLLLSKMRPIFWCLPFNPELPPHHHWPYKPRLASTLGWIGLPENGDIPIYGCSQKKWLDDDQWWDLGVPYVRTNPVQRFPARQCLTSRLRESPTFSYYPLVIYQFATEHHHS